MVVARWRIDLLLEVPDDQKDDVTHEVRGEEDEDHRDVKKEAVALRKWRTFSSLPFASSIVKHICTNQSLFIF